MSTTTVNHQRPDTPAGPAAPPTLAITVEIDPLRVRHGHRIDSTYVETFWLSHLGPSSVCVLRTIARMTESGGTVTVPYPALAEAIGLGTSAAKHAPLGRTLDRLVRYGAARWTATDRSRITIWSHLAPVPPRMRQHWPDWLQAAHDSLDTNTEAGDR